MTRLLCILFVTLLTLTACPMDAKPTDVLPRNMPLKAFDPHRKTFECKHEANAVPPIDPEAEAWFQEGMRVTSRDLWPNQRDYPQAVKLWAKAAERRHWKAMMNLAGVLIEGDGTEPFVVLPERERAVKIIEEGMRLGIPSAFDAMGSYHQSGLGVKGDSSRAYAFWELAADMGSPQAQAFLGNALRATYDNPKEGFWGNRKIGLDMLECSFAQSYGKAAYELGSDLRHIQKNYPRALTVLHEGVKMGSEECARSLAVIFSGPDAATGGSLTDTAREERYTVLQESLYHNPDLRFPNLDKVLPLPPARLPFWDGKKESLLNAAKAVVPVPPPPPKPAPSPASQRTGRAHIPEGFTLPEHPQVDVPAQYETTKAPVGGYWIARLMRHTQERHIVWDEAQLPMHYAEGELFDRTRPGLLAEDGRIKFHYLGDPVPVRPEAPTQHPLVARGIARHGDLPEPDVQCPGHATCPQTGIWSARVPDDHALAAVFNQWHRQAYVQRGQPFPDPRALHLDIAPRIVTWQWLAQVNEMRSGDWVGIRIDDPHARPAATPASEGARPWPPSTRPA